MADRRDDPPRVDYDELAPAYNRRFVPDDPTTDPRIAALRALVQEADAARVLEVGCGTGHWLAALSECVTQAHGLDLSAGMLGEAGGRPEPLRLVRGRAGRLPYASASFGLVYLSTPTASTTTTPSRCYPGRAALSDDLSVVKYADPEPAVAVGDDAGHPWIGQHQYSHPGHDVELGTLLPVYSVGPLVVDLDANGLVALPVHRAVLALGQYQRILGSANTDPTRGSIVGTP